MLNLLQRLKSWKYRNLLIGVIAAMICAAAGWITGRTGREVIKVDRIRWRTQTVEVEGPERIVTRTEAPRTVTRYVTRIERDPTTGAVSSEERTKETTEIGAVSSVDLERAARVVARDTHGIADNVIAPSIPIFGVQDPAPHRWRVSVLPGLSIDRPSLEVSGRIPHSVIGVSVERRITDHFSVGAWGSTAGDGSGGVAFSVSW